MNRNQNRTLLVTLYKFYFTEKHNNDKLNFPYWFRGLQNPGLISRFTKDYQMAKKYYEGKKDRKDESMGMSRYDKDKMDSSYYGMISEDRSAPANLPQQVVHKFYPKCQYFNSHELDDTINKIDETRRVTVRHMKSNESDVKI